MKPVDTKSKSALIQKLLRSNDGRRSRLHDRRGNLVPWLRLVLNGPRTLSSFLALRGWGWRPVRPWISYAATAAIARTLASRRCSVLEFGSGMSTLWFVKRAARVCSVEHDSSWYNLLNAKLSTLGFGPAVDYQLRTNVQEYYSFKADSADRFDILLVDGPWRTECLKHHLALVKPGGLIYVDNTDANSSSGQSGEMDLAVETLLAHARLHKAKIEWFTDFSPACLFATQGVMVRIPLSG